MPEAGSEPLAPPYLTVDTDELFHLKDSHFFLSYTPKKLSLGGIILPEGFPLVRMCFGKPQISSASCRVSGGSYRKTLFDCVGRGWREVRRPFVWEWAAILPSSVIQTITAAAWRPPSLQRAPPGRLDIAPRTFFKTTWYHCAWGRRNIQGLRRWICSLEIIHACLWCLVWPPQAILCVFCLFFFSFSCSMLNAALAPLQHEHFAPLKRVGLLAFRHLWLTTGGYEASKTSVGTSAKPPIISSRPQISIVYRRRGDA